MVQIRPGLHIEFIYYSDYVKERIRVMRSVVFDILDKKVILSQSTPSVLASGIRQQILATYLTREDGIDARLCFAANIINIIKDYEIASGEKVPAIIIEPMETPKPFNLRFHYRLNLPASNDISMHVGNEQAHLIDISVGGVKMRLTAAASLKPHQRIRLRLSFDGRQFDLEAEVLRVWFQDGSKTGNKDWLIAAIKFVIPSHEFEQFLSRKIFTIERELLAEGKMKQ